MNGCQIDLNCDMGEGFGAYQMGNDEAIMPYITSANIACGFHAGDPGMMKKTVQLALKYGVAIGAHPGLPDLQGFGRRSMGITDEEAYDLVLYQIGALDAFLKAEGTVLHHVKPHGALYNMAAVRASLAEAVVAAVQAYSTSLILYGLAGSELILAAERAGLPSAREIFADRTYQSDGSLTPRHLPGALISDPELAAIQVGHLLNAGVADTVCIHGDGIHALQFAEKLYSRFQASGLQVKSPTPMKK